MFNMFNANSYCQHLCLIWQNSEETPFRFKNQLKEITLTQSIQKITLSRWKTECKLEKKKKNTRHVGFYSETLKIQDIIAKTFLFKFKCIQHQSKFWPNTTIRTFTNRKDKTRDVGGPVVADVLVGVEAAAWLRAWAGMSMEAKDGLLDSSERQRAEKVSGSRCCTATPEPE